MRCHDLLAGQIQANGPMHIDQFIQTALCHPEHGYYARQDRFGSAGDFITAPEISQLFGEMMAGFLAYLWQASGQPDGPRMIRFEAGPGRGTLFGDMHKTCQKICPPLSHADPYFLEASPYLRRHLTEKIAPLTPLFCDQIAQLPPKPLFGIANEFFDALGVRQACFRRGRWFWRMIDIKEGGFIFSDGAPFFLSEQESALLPASPKEGDIYEISPLSEVYMAEISRHIAYHGGGFLICDYGKSDGTGDSLQAVKSHAKTEMLESPGEADITHLVDFSALARQAKAMGARLIGPVEQGAFLTELGIISRAEALRKAGQPEKDRLLSAALDRLCAPAHMGQIFKVALLVPAGDGLPPGFATLKDRA